MPRHIIKAWEISQLVMLNKEQNIKLYVELNQLCSKYVNDRVHIIRKTVRENHIDQSVYLWMDMLQVINTFFLTLLFSQIFYFKHIL